MFRVISLIVGYFIGNIQSAFIVGKFMNVDIRNHGSGNLGSTNALRVLGKKAGAITFISDILKAVISFVVCAFVFKADATTAGVYAVAGCVIGHDFPFYLKFKGGKGIAVMIGMLFCIGGLPPLLAFSLGLIGVYLTKYVSVGSIILSVVVAFTGFIKGYSMENSIILILLAVIALYQHKANITRLFNGTENKLGAKKTT